MKYRHATRFGILFTASMLLLSACDDDKKVYGNTEDRCTETSCGPNQRCNPDSGECEEKGTTSGCQSDDECNGNFCDQGKCVECTKDKHCNGQVCDQNKCVDCAKDDDCNGKVCNQNLCVECTKDEHCDGGGTCENNVCVYECSDDSDCSGGLVCEAHACVELWCDTDLNCPDRLVCKSDHHCGPECMSNSDCDDNKICSEEKRCIYECEQDTDCDGDLVCHDHRCAKECIENEDCGELKICDRDRNICRYECENDTDCSGNAQCKQYRCELECSDDKPCTSELTPFCSDQNHCVACRNDKDCEGVEMACDTSEHQCKNRCDILTCDENTEVCNREIGQCETLSCRDLACGDEDCILDADNVPHCAVVEACDFANDNDCDGIHDDADPCPYNPHVNSVEEGQTAECNIFTYDEVTVFEIWHASDLNRLKTLGASGIVPDICITGDNTNPCAEIRLMRNINLGDVSTAADAPNEPTTVRINGEELRFEDAACYMTYGELPAFKGTDAENLFVFDGLNHKIEANKADGTRCAMTHGLFKEIQNADLRHLTLNYGLHDANTYIAQNVSNSHLTDVHLIGNINVYSSIHFGGFAVTSRKNVYDSVSYIGSYFNKGSDSGLFSYASYEDVIDNFATEIDRYVTTDINSIFAYNMRNGNTDNDQNHHGYIRSPKIRIGTIYSNSDFSIFGYTQWQEHISGAGLDNVYDVDIDRIAFVQSFYGLGYRFWGHTTGDNLRIRIGELSGNTCYLVCETSWGGAYYHDLQIDIAKLDTLFYNGITKPYQVGYFWTTFERIKLRFDELISDAPSIFSNANVTTKIKDISIEIGSLTVNGGNKSIHGFSQELREGENLSIHVKRNILLRGDNNQFYGISANLGNIDNASFVVDGDLIVDGSNTTIHGLTGNLSSHINSSRMSYGNIIFNGTGGKLYSLVANGQDGSVLSNVDYSIRKIQSEHANTEVNLLAGNLVGTTVDKIRMRIEDSIAVNGNVYIVNQYEKSHLTDAAFELNSVSIGANQFVPFKQVKGDDNIFENIAIYTNVNTSNTHTSGFMGDLMTDQISLKNLSLASRFYNGETYLDIPAVLNNADTLLKDGHLDFSGTNGLPYMESVFFNVPTGVSGRACPDNLDCSNASSGGLFFIEYDNKPGAVRLILEKYLPNWIRAEFESNDERIYMPWPNTQSESTDTP